MLAIKSIKVGETTYDIKATYDGAGNAIDLTYVSDVSNLATKTELNGKVDKVTGKGLSTNDYTTTEKTKLTNISASVTGEVLFLTV